MSLTPEEKRRIYEEEKARIEARTELERTHVAKQQRGISFAIWFFFWWVLIPWFMFKWAFFEIPVGMIRLLQRAWHTKWGRRAIIAFAAYCLFSIIFVVVIVRM